MTVTPRRRGFTLIQLVGAVAIIGVITAIAIPTYATLRTNSERNTIDTSLRAIEQLAHGQAQATGDRGALFHRLVSAAASIDLPGFEGFDLEAGDPYPDTPPYVRFSDVDHGDALTVSMMRYGMCRQLIVDEDGNQGQIVDADPDKCLPPLFEEPGDIDIGPVTVTPGDGQLTVGFTPDPDLAYDLSYWPITSPGDVTWYATFIGLQPGFEQPTITGLRNGVTYVVRVTAFNQDGVRSDPQEASGTPTGGLPQLDAPDGHATQSGIRLSWDTSPINDDTIMYQVRRDDGDFQCMTSASWVDDGPPSGGAAYQVRALDGDVCSLSAPGGPWSDFSDVIVPIATELGAPELTVADITANGAQLEWEPPDFGTYTGFEVRHRVAPSPGVTADPTWGTWEPVGNVTSWLDTAAQGSMRHSYQVRATGPDDVTSAPSNTMTTDLALLALSSADEVVILAVDHHDDNGQTYAQLDGDSAQTRNGHAVVNDVEFGVVLPADTNRDQLRVRLSGTFIDDFADPTTGGSGTATFRLVDVPDGTYTIEVQAVDGSGNTVGPEQTSQVFTIDTTPPPMPENFTTYTQQAGEADNVYVTWDLGPAYDLNVNAWYDVRMSVDGSWSAPQTFGPNDSGSVVQYQNLGASIKQIREDNVQVCFQARTAEEHGTASHPDPPFNTRNVSTWEDIGCETVQGYMPTSCDGLDAIVHIRNRWWLIWRGCGTGAGGGRVEATDANWLNSQGLMQWGQTNASVTRVYRHSNSVYQGYVEISNIPSPGRRRHLRNTNFSNQCVTTMLITQYTCVTQIPTVIQWP